MLLNPKPRSMSISSPFQQASSAKPVAQEVPHSLSYFLPLSDCRPPPPCWTRELPLRQATPQSRLHTLHLEWKKWHLRQVIFSAIIPFPHPPSMRFINWKLYDEPRSVSRDSLPEAEATQTTYHGKNEIRGNCLFLTSFSVAPAHKALQNLSRLVLTVAPPPLVAHGELQRRPLWEDETQALAEVGVLLLKR